MSTYSAVNIRVELIALQDSILMLANSYCIKLIIFFSIDNIDIWSCTIKNDWLQTWQLRFKIASSNLDDRIPKILNEDRNTYFKQHIKKLELAGISTANKF